MYTKVRITQGHGWYFERVGKIFSTVKRSGYYFLREKDGTLTNLFIQPQHCRVIGKYMTAQEKREKLGKALLEYEKWFKASGLDGYMEIVSTKELLKWYDDYKGSTR